MAKTFEELAAWAQARELVSRMYELTKRQRFARDPGLTGQIRRSSVSVMANIAEGFERGSNTEFIQFLYIAKGSAGETRSHLAVALDQLYITADEHRASCEQCRRVAGTIAGLIGYLKDSALKGPKYRKAAS